MGGDRFSQRNTVAVKHAGYATPDTAVTRCRGYVNMRDRLSVIGGNLTIETCPGGGALLGARLKARGAMQLTAARITDPPAPALLLRWSGCSAHDGSGVNGRLSSRAGRVAGVVAAEVQAEGWVPVGHQCGVGGDSQCPAVHAEDDGE
jgi:hypothetical protein